MSAERMMVNAMQEQPILLLPLFMLVCVLKHFLRHAGNAFNANTLPRRLPH